MSTINIDYPFSIFIDYKEGNQHIFSIFTRKYAQIHLIMKKLVFFMAILGALIFGLTSNVKAQTVTIYCVLTLSDTCNGGGYNGNYDVTVELWVYGGGSPQCTFTGTTSAGGAHCVTLTSSCAPNQSICTYSEKLTKVVRSNGTCGMAPNYQSPFTYCWGDIASCSGSTPSFTVTL